ncbi:MAG: hypothetical protein K2O34_03370 [Acetatifactor sp.]|nr:hypothetical protein [Acetatifactor sp.]
MVKKNDWKTVEIPVQTEEFVLEKALTPDDIKLIKEGHRPKEMADKWFMYCEDNKLFIHRSWTGFCIYIVDISENGELKAIVNRDPGQYKETDIERDRTKLNILINSLIRRNGENARLMKSYIEQAKND